MVFKLVRVGELLAENVESKRGRNGKRYPNILKEPTNILESRLNGAKRIEKIGNGGWLVSFRDCGTIRGAGCPGEALGKEDEPFKRVSRCTDRVGRGVEAAVAAEAIAARASSSGSGASPSKNLAMAIWREGKDQSLSFAIFARSAVYLDIPFRSFKQRDRIRKLLIRHRGEGFQSLLLAFGQVVCIAIIRTRHIKGWNKLRVKNENNLMYRIVITRVRFACGSPATSFCL